MYYRTEVLQWPDGVRDWVRCPNTGCSSELFLIIDVFHLTERVCDSSQQGSWLRLGNWRRSSTCLLQNLPLFLFVEVVST